MTIAKRRVKVDTMWLWTTAPGKGFQTSTSARCFIRASVLAWEISSYHFNYTVSTKKRPPPTHALKFSKLASFAQSQFNSMNICLFSIKVPILVKICPTVIEILTFNKWSQKFCRFQKRDFLLTVNGVNWRQHRRKCRIGKTKTKKMVFSTENLVLIKVLHQEKVMTIDE